MNFINYFNGSQPIEQLEKNKGGYYYLKIEAEIINQFKNKRATRLICTIDEKVTYRCGLNHLGNGDFFIIISTKNLRSLNKKLGESVNYQIEEDPDQLGVAIPEVLEVLLTQEANYKNTFDKMTDGKKRSLIFSLLKMKDIDKQVQFAMNFLDKNQPLIN